MPLISRRTFLLGAGAAAVPLSLGGYSLATESSAATTVVQYAISPPDWQSPTALLRIGVVADLHACDPWMPMPRIASIVEATNALNPDLIVLLGDFVEGVNRLYANPIPMQEWAAALADLHAPLGVFAILGNHDWWHDGPAVRAAMEARAIPVMENDATLITLPTGETFWLGGLGDQLAFRHSGVDDLDGLTAKIPDDDRPAILLIHEPDIFVRIPKRYGLTLAGHTHGGQIALPLLGRFPVASEYGQRYAYGHIHEDDRHMIISSGLGVSGIPIRFGVPPEIVLVTVGSPAALAAAGGAV